MTDIKILPPKMPDKIYLQIEYDGEEMPDGWTWCADRVNESDIEYVRVKLPLDTTPKKDYNGK